MDIKERNERIAQHTDIVTFGGKNLKKKTMDVTAYWNTLTRPPIKAYLPDWVVQKLYEYMTSARLINNPSLRFKLTNELLLPWGFKPLASGTNRRAFYCTYDPGIIIKIASDAVGQKDNQSEFVIQQMLKPFCPKIFDVAGDGAVLLSERGEPMTEHDYKFVWAEEIFDLLFSLLARGYILEDVGSNFYKNFGIRMGFGPMLWDFPYVYKLDWRKLICQKPDPITGQPCGGEIDYDYHKGMSEIVCTRCGARYSAKYLASAMPSEAFTFVNRERRCIRVGRFDTKFEVFVRQGDKIVATYGNETATPQPQIAPRRNLMPGEEPNLSLPGVVTQQPNQQQVVVSAQASPVVVNAMQQGLVMDQAMINSTNQMYGNPGTSVTVDTIRQEAVSQNIVAPYGPVPGQAPSNYIITNQHQPSLPGKVVATPPTPKRETITTNGQKGITITPEEFLSLLATCQASGKEIPISLIQAAPELAATMLPNQVEPKYTKPIKTVGPVKDFEHYYENGKRYFMYPRDIRGQVYSWLNNMAHKFGDEIAILLAEKLEIAFTPKKDPKPPTPTNPPRQEKADVRVRVSFPHIMPSTPKASKPKVITRTSPQQVQSQIAGTHYPGIGHQMVQQPSVETVIAPRPERKMLDVENPNTWKSVGTQPQATSESTSNYVDPSQGMQTTNLFPVKPMTVEEKEEADAKASNEQGITGFPGVAMVDSLRFKSEVPKVKAAVEARFSDFSLSVDDADRQIAEMAARIKDFIANDVATIMGTDTNGLEVNIVRTTDHRNNDCFKVDVLNYKSPVFVTVLYPNNEQVDEALTQVMEEEQAQVQEPVKEEVVEDSMQIPQEELEAFFASSLKGFDSSKYNTVEEVKNELVSFLLGRLLDTYNKDGIQRITTPRAYKEANAYVEQAVEIQDNTSKQPKSEQKLQQQKPKVVPPQPAPRMASGSAGASL